MMNIKSYWNAFRPLVKLRKAPTRLWFVYRDRKGVAYISPFSVDIVCDGKSQQAGIQVAIWPFYVVFSSVFLSSLLFKRFGRCPFDLNTPEPTELW